jgi:hypothetical protein
MITLSLAVLVGLFLLLSSVMAWVYFHFKKQLRDVRRSSEPMIFGPGLRLDEHKEWMRNQRKIRKKYLLSFKWIWYWMTEQSITNRKLRRHSSKLLRDSMKARQLKAKLKNN